MDWVFKLIVQPLLQLFFFGGIGWIGMIRRSGRTRGKRCPGIIGGHKRLARSPELDREVSYRACLLAVGGPVMGTQLMRKRTRNIVIKKDFHDRNPSLMREAIVNDCLYLSRVEIINVGYLIGGKARLIVVQDEVSLHTGVLENRHPAQFALYLLNLITA
jgi:hypothetical protein